MKLLLKVFDFLLSTYLFIASASVCLVLETNLLVAGKPDVTGLSMFIFFSTILIYNFHRVSGLFEDHFFSVELFSERLKKIPFSVKMMTCIAVTGMLSSACFIQVKTLFWFLPLALLTLAYSVPVLKVNGKMKRLREIFLVKITTLAFVWSFVTVTLPFIDFGIDVFTKSSLSIFAQRFLFMLAICIPFEIRDMEQEKKWGNMTLPQLIGINKSKMVGVFALLIFTLLVFFQFDRNEIADHSIHHYTAPLIISAIIASLFILSSHQHRSNYYFRIFTDGTMQLQFILLLLFNPY